MTIVAALLVTPRRGVVEPATAETSATPTVAAPPDLTTMTPKEQFDRLFNRVMAAAEAGDSGTVARFAPMAMGAYGNLADPDADARYHAAMIRLEVGDRDAAAALADTILAANPRHLLGLAVRIAVGTTSGDAAAVARSRQALLSGWEAEQATGRQEYRDHQSILTRFHDEARSAPGRRP